MQKFTRALTREVEVAGERLALTLDADGVTIRPVGSRRPPRVLPWGVVLCAAAGQLPAGDAPNADEVAAALKVLQGGPGGAVRQGLAGGADDLEGLLVRLDAWLAKHRRRYHDGLAPGATPESLARLESRLGQDLPDDLEALLEWHDGQLPDLVGAFLGAWRFLGTGQVAEERHEALEAKGLHYRAEWLPFLADGQGDYVVLDTTAKGHPVREVWRGRAEHPVVAASLAEYLGTFVRDVEAGRYHEDEERGEFHRSRG